MIELIILIGSFLVGVGICTVVFLKQRAEIKHLMDSMEEVCEELIEEAMKEHDDN